MQFTVPKFIEMKPKIIGPLTFQQFAYLGVAGVISFFIYFIVPIYTFVIALIFLLSLAGALAFVKIGKVSLPVVIKNLIIFIFHPKIYLWKRKSITTKIIRKEREIEEKKEESPLRISENSRLKELSARIETKSK